MVIDRTPRPNPVTQSTHWTSFTGHPNHDFLNPVINPPAIKIDLFPLQPPSTRRTFISLTTTNRAAAQSEMEALTILASPDFTSKQVRQSQPVFVLIQMASSLSMKAARPLICGLTPADGESGRLSAGKVEFVKMNGIKSLGLSGGRPIKAMEDQTVSLTTDAAALNGINPCKMSTVGNSTNIRWHHNGVEKVDRQRLLQQKGCVIWITGLSGSGKSTVACALSQGLHSRGKLTYILDGDNVRHGLCRDLSFKAEDRAENIRRIAEVAKLFADAGIICIASLISPYRKDRDACRALYQDGDFIEVYMDVPLNVCENRDPKGLYKLARAEKIKGFTGVDDPYEPPLNCEIVLQQKGKDSVTPSDMAGTVISYLEEKGYLQA